MLAPNDARITGLRLLEPHTGSGAGVAVAGSPLEVAMSVEAGAALFGTGARFVAGVQIEGIPTGAIERVEGWLGDAEWPSLVAEVRFSLLGSATAALADRLLGVAGFLRINAAPPFLVSSLRGPDLFVTPGSSLA